MKSEIIRTRFGEYAHNFNLVEQNGQLYACDCFMEHIVEGHCCFQHFMLNREQLTKMNKQYY